MLAPASIDSFTRASGTDNPSSSSEARKTPPATSYFWQAKYRGFINEVTITLRSRRLRQRCKSVSSCLVLRPRRSGILTRRVVHGMCVPDSSVTPCLTPLVLEHMFKFTLATSNTPLAHLRDTSWHVKVNSDTHEVGRGSKVWRERQRVR